MQLRMRLADHADAPVIADCNCRLAWETEQLVLPAETVLNGVRRGLQCGAEVQYWVADWQTADGWQIAGQLMLTREWSDWRDGWLVWLQSVYVIPEARRRGVFRQLLQHVQQQLRQQPEVVGLRLYVEHANTRALQTYQQLGFQDAGYLVLEQLFQRTGR